MYMTCTYMYVHNSCTVHTFIYFKRSRVCKDIIYCSMNLVNSKLSTNFAHSNSQGIVIADLLSVGSIDTSSNTTYVTPAFCIDSKTVLTGGRRAN